MVKFSPSQLWTIIRQVPQLAETAALQLLPIIEDISELFTLGTSVSAVRPECIVRIVKKEQSAENLLRLETTFPTRFDDGKLMLRAVMKHWAETRSSVVEIMSGTTGSNQELNVILADTALARATSEEDYAVIYEQSVAHREAAAMFLVTRTNDAALLRSIATQVEKLRTSACERLRLFASNPDNLRILLRYYSEDPEVEGRELLKQDTSQETLQTVFECCPGLRAEVAALSSNPFSLGDPAEVVKAVGEERAKAFATCLDQLSEAEVIPFLQVHLLQAAAFNRIACIPNPTRNAVNQCATYAPELFASVTASASTGFFSQAPTHSLLHCVVNHTDLSVKTRAADAIIARGSMDESQEIAIINQVIDRRVQVAEALSKRCRSWAAVVALHSVSAKLSINALHGWCQRPHLTDRPSLQGFIQALSKYPVLLDVIIQYRALHGGHPFLERVTATSISAFRESVSPLPLGMRVPLYSTLCTPEVCAQEMMRIVKSEADVPNIVVEAWLDSIRSEQISQQARAQEIKEIRAKYPGVDTLAYAKVQSILKKEFVSWSSLSLCILGSLFPSCEELAWSYFARPSARIQELQIAFDNFPARKAEAANLILEKSRNSILTSNARAYLASLNPSKG